MSGMKLRMFTTPLVVFTILSVPSSSLTITETAEGCHRILYCQETKDNDTVLWYKNNLKIMETSKDSDGSNSSVSLRDVQDGTTLVDVSVSEKRHSLTLMVSLLFGESVWRCETVQGVSENLTLSVTGLTKESGIQYNLTSATAVEGNTFKLSCIHASGLTLTTALWYRNCVEIFQTNVNENQMLPTNNHNAEFRSVSQRVSVESDRTRHSMTLTINATLDEGSVWTCGNGQTVSNSITVIIMEPITEESSTPISSTDRQTTDRQTTSRQTTRAVMDTVTKDDRPSAKDEPLIYAIAGSAGGFLLLVCILSIACISSRRSRDVYPSIDDNTLVSSDAQQQLSYLVLTNAMLQGNTSLSECRDNKD